MQLRRVLKHVNDHITGLISTQISKANRNQLRLDIIYEKYSGNIEK